MIITITYEDESKQICSTQLELSELTFKQYNNSSLWIPSEIEDYLKDAFIKLNQLKEITVN